MQALRPSPGLVNQSLPFNKTLRGSTGTLKCAKRASAAWVTSEMNMYKNSLMGNDSLPSLASENFRRNILPAQEP